ncbi:MAG: adenylate/guanylate cyclase domain-containing protein, partial [Candidatus Eremiobacteraeota bacterium]|nr:adenylate/guanylate cyclase domain-containing protein [Candidatus Eremiobacteraeota bacterium]
MLTALPTGTVTFVFTDIEGSTRLWEAQPDAMRPALAEHDALVRAAIERAGGAVFKTVGDAFCAAFARAGDAVAAAVDVQRSLARHGWPPEIGRLRVRIAVHTGAAIERDGDYFGPTLNRVARLLDLAAGEQILVSAATAAVVRDALPRDVVLRDLGPHRLKDLGLPETAYQVQAADLRVEFPPLPSLDTRPNNLPWQISSYVGRQRALEALREALATRRLVSVVGPGGIGKTRFALQGAAAAIDAFEGGAWVVPLADVNSESLLVQSVAQTLDVHAEGGHALDASLLSALEEKKLLLVLDCVEHIVAEAGRFVKRILAGCAGVKVLVTSREPLHIAGEHVLRLGPLDCAEQLFRERATDVAEAAIEEADDARVARICARLDGIPLAIELAAARVATMPLPELERRLSKRLDVLVSRDPSIDPRHRTLKATIDWSYGTLGERESAFLRSLAVLSGWFSAGAAGAIAGVDAATAGDMLEDLALKSLVATRGAEADDVEARFVVYDTVREYLAELVERNAERGGLEERHCAHFERRAEAIAQKLPVAEQARLFREADLDAANFRAALAYAIDNDPDRAARIACNLFRYWKLRGRTAEGRDWCENVLTKPTLATTHRAALLRRAATLATDQDDYVAARAMTDDAERLYRSIGDDGGIAEALHNRAVIEQRTGDASAGKRWYEEAIKLFRKSGNRYGLAVALLNRAMIEYERSDLPTVRASVDEALAASTFTNDVELEAHLRAFAAMIANREGRSDDAVREYQAAIALQQRLGNDFAAAELSASLAEIYVMQDRIDQAIVCSDHALRIGLDLQANSVIIAGLETYVQVFARRGDWQEAVRCFAASQYLRELHSFHHTVTRNVAVLEQTLRRGVDLDRCRNAIETEG